MNKSQLAGYLQAGAAPEPQNQNQSLNQNPQNFMNAVANQYTAMTSPSAKASAQSSNTCAHCGQDLPQDSGAAPASGLGTQGS